MRRASHAWDPLAARLSGGPLGGSSGEERGDSQASWPGFDCPVRAHPQSHIHFALGAHAPADYPGVTKVHDLPPIYTVDDFLTGEECE